MLEDGKDSQQATQAPMPEFCADQIPDHPLQHVSGLFRHRELKYYSFGLRAGLANLFRNGFRLGLERTLGKITQPINWYTRFPEYHYFDSAISRYLCQLPATHLPRILDIGSPKMLGLYLAFARNVEIMLTDISDLNISPYQHIWDCLSHKAQGKAFFSYQDTRALSLANAEFDVVYAMSVIEHVEGPQGDSEAVREMIRVLRPGGLFVISVPFGPKYTEQAIVGMAAAARPTHDSKQYFFQRIYDIDSFNSRIMRPADELKDFNFVTVWRKHLRLHRSYARLGKNVRGALGFLNPCISAIANESCNGVKDAFPTSFSALHSLQDVYGDLIMVGTRK
jgi:SAM-dependent methyltransferase